MNRSASPFVSTTPHLWGINGSKTAKKHDQNPVLATQTPLFHNEVCVAMPKNRHLWQLVEIDCNRWQVLMYNTIVNRHLWPLKSPFLTR